MNYLKSKKCKRCNAKGKVKRISKYGYTCDYCNCYFRVEVKR